MRVLESLQKFKAPPPLGFTLGSFDGVHKGHQSLFKFLRSLVGPQGTLAALTFSNHPSHILPGATPIALISSIPQKLYALQSCGIDITFLLPFTLELAAQTYDQFIKKIYKDYPFAYFVLGKGAVLGKNREGTPEKLQLLARTMGFEMIYLDKTQIEGKDISSKEIRALIQSGKFKNVAQFLGRPYSLQGPIVLDAMNSKKATLSLEGICHPLHGEYPVEIVLDYHTISAVAKFREFSVEILSSKELQPKIVEINF